MVNGEEGGGVVGMKSEWEWIGNSSAVDGRHREQLSSQSKGQKEQII